jgi:toxin ParE1/3/4
MSERRYRLSNRAINNLEGIASYIGERDVAAADRVINALIGCFAKLAENPEIGMKRDDLRPGLRVFSPPRPAQNYVVAFYEAPCGVEINAVIHGSRDWPELVASRPH